MGGFIVKQPNGLYCRFSSVVDCPTNWNMTEQDYIELCKQRAEEEAKEILARHLRPFERVIEDFIPNNMTPEEFRAFLGECGADEDVEFYESGDDVKNRSITFEVGSEGNERAMRK